MDSSNYSSYLCVVISSIAMMIVTVSAQEHTDIGNDVIHKVINGKSCGSPPRLDNVRAKLKLGGKLAKYSCRGVYSLVGNSMSVCVDGTWSHDKQVCAAAGCPHLSFQSEGVNETIAAQWGSVAIAYDYTCQHGYHGDNAKQYCNGATWVGTKPECYKIQGISCAFEDGLSPACDQWVNDDDHDIYWTRHTDETNNEGTGPSYDHTLGNNGAGHYMYVNSKSAEPGHTARLFSPTLHPEVQWCVGFWYHMYGQGADGTLMVATETQVEESKGDFEPIILLEGNQGDRWQYASAQIPTQKEDFQVLFQATLNTSTRNDIGIDDVSVMPCKDMKSPPEVVIVTQETSTESVQPLTSDSSVQPGISSTTEFVDIIMTSEANVSSSNVTMVTPGEPPVAGLQSSASDTNFPLIAGVVGGAVFVMLCLAAVLHQVVRRRTRGAASDEGAEMGDHSAFAYTVYNNDSSI